MKKMLRFTSFLLCAALTISLMTPVSHAVRFRDVPADNWAAGRIERCVNLGFFKGESADRFGLGHCMTRCAFAAVLCRFFGWKAEKPAYPTYKDVPPDKWYAGSVEAAFSHGAFTSRENNFRPKDPITREELTVALVRALGYAPIAGLAQKDPLPFKDVTTNNGYIAMAYECGIINGTSATTFSPDRRATREQVAVILIRLYDKLHSSAPKKIGILRPSSSGLQTVPAGYAAMIVPGGQMFRSSLQFSENSKSRTLTDSIHSTGAKALLQMSGSAAVLGEIPRNTVGEIIHVMNEYHYDGVCLDISRVTSKTSAAVTALAKELKHALNGKPLYLIADAPARQSSDISYDFASLGKLTDQLILQMQPHKETSGHTVIVPSEPLEDLYYALRQVKHSVSTDKLTVLLTSTGTAWSGSSRRSYTPREIERMIQNHTADKYSSARYACPYLTTSSSTTIWYLDQAAVSARVQMGKLFGVSQFCVSDIHNSSSDFLAGLK